MKRKTSKLVMAASLGLMLSFAASPAMSQDSGKTEVKKTGSEAKKAGTSLGSNVARGGKQFGKHMGKAGKNLGRGTKKAFKKIFS